GAPLAELPLDLGIAYHDHLGRLAVASAARPAPDLEYVFDRLPRNRLGGGFLPRPPSAPGLPLPVGRMTPSRPPPQSLTAPASISTFQRRSSRPATTTIVLAGRTSAKTAPCARPTASQSAASVRYDRVRTTCCGPAPASPSAARMISKQRRACASGS